MISGKTKVCFIIGDPIEHSLSPAIHNAAFAACSLDFVFVALHVKRESLKEAVAGMRAFNMAGGCVTIPHKVAVMQYLDNIDPVALEIGSVNTIVNNNGILTGYNTDAPGFLEPLANREIELEGKNAVLLGAGGAARAVSFMLVNEGVKLTILNRTLDKALDLADRLKKSLRKDVVPLAMTPQNLEDSVCAADILVNTTSIGMTPDINNTPVPAGLLRKGLVVYDIIYNPAMTRLLKEAKAKGAVTINGEQMLAWQGALAFEKWTGQKAPIDIMIQALHERLGTHED
jgi:shikimate dehydrogenase